MSPAYRCQLGFSANPVVGRSAYSAYNHGVQRKPYNRSVCLERIPCPPQRFVVASPRFNTQRFRSVRTSEFQMDQRKARRRRLGLACADIERIAASITSRRPNITSCRQDVRFGPSAFIPDSALSGIGSGGKRGRGPERHVFSAFLGRITRGLRGNPRMWRVELEFRGPCGSRSLALLGRSLAVAMGRKLPPSQSGSPLVFPPVPVRVNLVVKRVTGGFNVLAAAVVGSTTPVRSSSKPRGFRAGFRRFLIRCDSDRLGQGHDSSPDRVHHRGSGNVRGATLSGDGFKPTPVVRSGHRVGATAALGRSLGFGKTMRLVCGTPTREDGSRHDDVPPKTAAKEEILSFLRRIHADMCLERNGFGVRGDRFRDGCDLGAGAQMGSPSPSSRVHPSSQRGMTPELGNGSSARDRSGSASSLRSPERTYFSHSHLGFNSSSPFLRRSQCVAREPNSGIRVSSSPQSSHQPLSCEQMTTEEGFHMYLQRTPQRSPSTTTEDSHTSNSPGRA